MSIRNRVILRVQRKCFMHHCCGSSPNSEPVGYCSIVMVPLPVLVSCANTSAAEWSAWTRLVGPGRLSPPTGSEEAALLPPIIWTLIVFAT